MLDILDRNRRIKRNPEKFQTNFLPFDIILSCEERVYDQILDNFKTREQSTFEQCHIINCIEANLPIMRQKYQYIFDYFEVGAYIYIYISRKLMFTDLTT